MNNSINIKPGKFFIAMCLVGLTHIAMASFTGTTEESLKSKYSLKQFNKSFYRSASPFTLTTGFQFKGIRQLSSQKTDDGSITYTSMMRFEKGNVTYIYPYKHTVKLPKFKAPAAPLAR